MDHQKKKGGVELNTNSYVSDWILKIINLRRKKALNEKDFVYHALNSINSSFWPRDLCMKTVIAKGVSRPHSPLFFRNDVKLLTKE